MSEQDSSEEKGSPFAPEAGEPLPPMHKRTVRMIAYADPTEYSSCRSWIADLDESVDWFDQQEQIISRTTYLNVGDERVELKNLPPKHVTDLKVAVENYDRLDLAVVNSDEVADDYVLNLEHDGMQMLTDKVTELLPELYELERDDESTEALARDTALHALFDESGERVLKVQAFEPETRLRLKPVSERTTPEVFRYNEDWTEERFETDLGPDFPGFVVEVYIGWTAEPVLTDLTEAVAIPLRDKLEEIDAIDTVRLDYVQSVTRTQDA